MRIIRTCKEMGIYTVAVYSEADRESLHVALADQAICIGGPVRRKVSRRRAHRRRSFSNRAQAIHPGYGFLSENAEFAALLSKSMESCLSVLQLKLLLKWEIRIRPAA